MSGNEVSPAGPAPRGNRAGRWTFLVILALCVAGATLVACQNPGPAGYNVITGEGAMGPGEFGVSSKNVATGVGLGLPFGLLLGGIGAGLVHVCRALFGRR